MPWKIGAVAEGRKEEREREKERKKEGKKERKKERAKPRKNELIILTIHAWGSKLLSTSFHGTAALILYCLLSFCVIYAFSKYVSCKASIFNKI